MTAPAWAEQALREAQQRPPSWAWWLLLPWLALSVALEDALRCWERRLR